MPKIITIFNLTLICVRIGLGNSEYAKRLFLIAQEAEKYNITFAPQLFAEIALCETSEEIDNNLICDKLNTLSKKTETFIEETCNFYKEWHDVLLQGDNKALENFAKTRLY